MSQEQPPCKRQKSEKEEAVAPEVDAFFAARHASIMPVLEAASSQIVALKQETKVQQARLEELNEQHARLTRQLQEQTQRAQEAETRATVVQGRVGALENKVAGHERSLQGTTAEVASLRTHIAGQDRRAVQLEAQVRDLTAGMDKLMVDNKDLQRRDAAWLKNRNKLFEENKKLRAKMRAIQQQLSGSSA